MFKTFACPVADLLDDEKRKAWDKQLSDFEVLVEKADCAIVNANAQPAEGVHIANFHVRASGYVDMPTPQGMARVPQKGIRTIGQDAFDKAVATAAAAGDGTGRTVRGPHEGGPRILGR